MKEMHVMTQDQESCVANPENFQRCCGSYSFALIPYKLIIFLLIDHWSLRILAELVI